MRKLNNVWTSTAQLAIFSVMVLALLGASGPAQAGSAYGLSTSGGPVSASARLTVKVVIPPHTIVALSDRGPAAFTNIRGTARSWTCSFTKIAGIDEPTPPAELAGSNCNVRSVSRQQAAEHGLFSGLTYAVP